MLSVSYAGKNAYSAGKTSGVAFGADRCYTAMCSPTVVLFLDTETAEIQQFLDPEIVKMLQFLDPETKEMVDKSYIR